MYSTLYKGCKQRRTYPLHNLQPYSNWLMLSAKYYYTVLVVGHSTMAIQSYILAYYRTDRYICSNIQPIQTYTSRWSKRRDNQICASCPPLIEEIQVWSRVYTGTS